MRIVFMGTPDFAVASLDQLVKNDYEVVGVVTAPDKPSGRGLQMNASAVKQYALEHHLPLLQPTNLKSEAFHADLKALRADLQIVVAFRMLPEAVWNMPALGTYNLHASLLPKYRGAAPINWAVINGEKESGVTTFKLKHEIDTGNILLQEKVPISSTDTAGDLHDKLMVTGANLLLETVKEIAEKTAAGSPLKFVEQDDALGSHAPKLFKENCRINWHKPANEVYNLVRGLSPYPTAFTQISSGGMPPKNLKIFYGEPGEEKHDKAAGLISTDHKSFLEVYCGSGILRITDLQIEGKKRMPVSEFLKGFKISDNAMMLS